MFRRIKMTSPTNDIKYVGMKDCRIKAKIEGLKSLYNEPSAKQSQNQVVMMNPKHMIYGLSARKKDSSDDED